MVWPVLRAGGLLLGMLVVGLAASPQEPAATEPGKNDESKIPHRLEIAGIENTFRLSPRLYSGGNPHGAEALKALKALGIRTVVSVDGAAPDVETARKLGLRYVHLPIGYDGVPREQAVKLIKALKTLPGPVYIHCHHGKHRGPTAAALCGLATEGWTQDDAIGWMKVAGTSPDYRGLYSAARAFVPPSLEELERAGTELPERTKVPAFVELMIRIDEQWDRLKAVEKSCFKAPENQPDLDPAHEALQLVENLREVVRLREAKERGADFASTANLAEQHARSLEQALREFAVTPTAKARMAVEAAFLEVGKSCTACHSRYRDRK